jgi:hypothetical protein
MAPFDVYQTYLALKNHFTKSSYNFYKYNGKTRASLKTFYKRKDRFFFERLSRQKNNEEVLNFFVSNFVSCSNPQSFWIGDIINNGESIYQNWLSKTKNLENNFESDLKPLILEYGLKDSFKIVNQKHPVILKKFLVNEVSLESLVILNKLYKFVNYYDDKLTDPIWEFVSLRIKKYSDFIIIEPEKFREIINTCINNESVVG